jgi:hypothetical protein
MPSDVSPSFVCAGLERATIADGDALGQSLAVRGLARRALATRLGLEEAQLEIRKHDRIPHLYANGRPISGDLSLSHHGGVVAYAFCSLPAAGALQAAGALPAAGALQAAGAIPAAGVRLAEGVPVPSGLLSEMAS